MRRSFFIVLAQAAILVGTAAVPAVDAEPSYEATVQFALENLVSGHSTAAPVGKDRVTVMPLRTWRSVSGHYCRAYAVTHERPGGATDRDQGLRCRDGDGTWKQVSRN